MISFQHHAQLSVEVSDVDSYYSDLPTLPTTPHGNDQPRQLSIPQDPGLWESIEVLAWLDWAVLRHRGHLQQRLPGESLGDQY